MKETFARTKPGYSALGSTDSNFVDIDIVTTAGVITTYDVVFDAEPDTDFYALIYATVFMGTGTMKPKSSAFKLLASENVPSTPFTIDLKDQYIARFGSPGVGNKIFTKVVFVDSTTGASYGAGTISHRSTGT